MHTQYSINFEIAQDRRREMLAEAEAGRPAAVSDRSRKQGARRPPRRRAGSVAGRPGCSRALFKTSPMWVARTAR